MASGSPRRVELLGQMFSDFSVIPADIEELIPVGTPPEQAVCMLSEQKARWVAERHPDALVIGADTVVSLGEEILTKPADAADAKRMLLALSGVRHIVYTGVTLCCKERCHQFCEKTEVQFHPLTPELIDWYIETGEPFDKAGAYGIQGKGAVLVSGVFGDYFNVMGFPISKVWREIINFGN